MTGFGALVAVAAAGLAMMAVVPAAVAQEDNKAIVQRAFDAWAAGTGSPYDLLADNAVWTIAGNSLVAGNRVTLLQDGPATYQAMDAAIAGATNSIDMESYIIEDDEVGRRFACELEAATARGVVVNLVYDAVGSLGTPRAYFDDLAAHGVHVLQFNPIDPLKARAGWRSRRGPASAGWPHRGCARARR